MPDLKLDTAYATLMSCCNQGTFLYTPDIAKRFHPGACGFFDENGLWREITDLVNIGKLRNSYDPPHSTLKLEDPFPCNWNKKIVEKEEGQHARATTGVSAAVAAAIPVDASANATIGSTAAAGASLVVSPRVVRYQFDTEADEIVKKWVVDNAEDLMLRHSSQITERGLWVVMTTWVTKKCKISMWNKKGTNLDLGLDLGMTGIGKLGIGGGRYLNAKIDEHATYSDANGYVISFMGLYFKPNPFKIFGEKLKLARLSPGMKFKKSGHRRVEFPTLELDTEMIGQPTDEEGQQADQGSGS